MQPTDHKFLTHFNLCFPLPQATSWILCSLNTKTIGKLYSMLQTTTSPWAWWQQTTQNTSITGGTGKNSFGPILMTTFRASLAKNKYPCAKPSLNGHGKANWDGEHKSKPDRYKMRSQPLARASNWKGTKSPQQKRNHRVPHMHCMTTGILQTNGPTNVTTTSSASQNTKLDLQHITNIQLSPHSCNWRTMPYHILFFIMCGQIHTITEQLINKNTTIPTS